MKKIRFTFGQSLCDVENNTNTQENQEEKDEGNYTSGTTDD